MMELSMVGGILAVIYFVIVAAAAVVTIWIAVLLIKFLQLKNAELRLRLTRDPRVLRDDEGPNQA